LASVDIDTGGVVSTRLFTHGLGTSGAGPGTSASASVGTSAGAAVCTLRIADKVLAGGPSPTTCAGASVGTSTGAAICTRRLTFLSWLHRVTSGNIVAR
jgi:hypothetical protein